MFDHLAATPETSKGRLFKENDSDHNRSPYERDRSRVIHSSSFRKLKYKTQVFIESESDYYRTRLTHSLEVSQISRSICRLLNLNEDKLEWTARKMEESGVKYFVGAHCTGLNSTYSIRNFMNLSSKNALVGSVGTYITKKGIFPGYMQ